MPIQGMRLRGHKTLSVCGPDCSGKRQRGTRWPWNVKRVVADERIVGCRRPKKLIGSCKQYPFVARLPGQNTGARFFFRIQGYATNGGFGLLFDGFFGFGCAVPMRAHKAGFFVEGFYKFIPRIYGCHVFVAEVVGFVVNRILNSTQQFINVLVETVSGNRWFFFGIAARHFGHAIFQIARANGYTHGYAFHFVFGKFPTRA